MKHTIYQLELLLLDSSIRQSAEKLNELLADNFMEFGSSGEVYNKNTVIQSLLLDNPQIFTIEDFAITELSDNAILATYKSLVSSKYYLRSSIWKFNGIAWQMVFHQGTECKCNV
jgi:hypothetical protein